MSNERRPMMDTIVAKLSEIEHAANAVVLHAEEEKKELERQIQAERDAFDAELEEKTVRDLSQIREGMEWQMSDILARQKRRDASEIEKMQKDFEKKHTVYATEVLKRIVEG